MSQRTLLQPAIGALFVLLPWFGGLVVGEVGNDFSHCLDFFYKEIPPTGINAAGYQPICQRHKNQYHFASMYHRQHRAPLFSAYILRLKDSKRPEDIWMYEPQLASSKASPEMKPFDTPVDQNVIESQAVLEDYSESIYTKGHLNPSMHQKTKEDQEATFTLTNIVPQRIGSNSGPWSQLEENVLKKFKTYCTGEMYVITGAMPFKSGAHWINGRVSVPEYMWSAYCCPSFKAKLPESVQMFFPTYAAVGRNDPDSGEEIVPVDVKAKKDVRGYDVKPMPLQTLEDILAQRLGMSISLFDGHCQK
ncbi:endonuclease domain-containing 1 protein-like [Embiotoca jacksoni]|uniref:endonuclease domain-containing 1 protein-like n=1 Tax=Embiotoca jacksoni TaxID=100190 RepID=UPI003704905E